MASAAPPADGYPSRAYVVAIPTIVTAIIAAILTGLRLYVRTRLLKKLEWDDFFNVLAIVSGMHDLRAGDRPVQHGDRVDRG